MAIMAQASPSHNPPIYKIALRPNRIRMYEVAKEVKSFYSVMNEDIRSANYPLTALSTMGLQ
jgi:hypothetical protein